MIVKKYFNFIKIWESITNILMSNLNRYFSKLSPYKCQKLLFTYLKSQKSIQRFFYNILFLNSFSDKVWLTMSHNLMILFKRTIIFFFFNRNAINQEVTHFTLIHNMLPKLLDFPSLLNYRHIVAHNPCNILNNGQYVKLYW